MENRTSGSIIMKDDGCQFLGQLHMFGNSYQMQTSAAPSFFLPSSSPPLQLLQQQNQAPAQKSEAAAAAGSSFLSDLGSYGRIGAPESLCHGLSFGPSLSMAGRISSQPEAPLPPQGTIPPEALLDAITLAQRRLQHLEAIVRMMMQGDARHGIVAQQQQQQSLSTEFASVMSQLVAATASFSSSPRFQASAPAPTLQVHDDAFDFGLDGFNEDDLNSTLGGGAFCPPPPSSGMDVMPTTSEMWEGASVRLPTMGTGTTGSLRPGSINSSDESANIFTTVSARNDINSERDLMKGTSNRLSAGTACKPCVGDDCDNHIAEDHREDDDDGEGESLPPGSYELVELAATEILAEHTHFCEICSKGFKRDANLRMHMRGHGDEYKTAAALARPDKTPRDASVKLRRYSCPYDGCKRNKKHQKFQPLKTMLCVKNHYRRSHCPKVLVCSRCKVKKFSVVADLKTHEKHCGQEKWQCSCGTTFSRKDKLYGHIGLFAGHSPATPSAHEIESLGGIRDTLDGMASCSKPVDASSIPGLSDAAAAMQANLSSNTSHMDVSQGGMGSYDVTAVMTGRRAAKNAGSHNEQGSNTGAFLGFSNGQSVRDSSFHSGPLLSGVGSDASVELQKLLSNSLFRHGRGTD